MVRYRLGPDTCFTLSWFTNKKKKKWGDKKQEKEPARGVGKQEGPRKTNGTPCVWEEMDGHVGKYAADAPNYYRILAGAWCMDCCQGYEV